MKLVVLLAVLGLAASGEALKCYACQSMSKAGDFDFSSVVGKVIGLSSCDDFNASSPDKKFVKECSAIEKGCMKIVDPKNVKSQYRGCGPMAKDECNDNTCHCTADLCNGSERGWPSAVLLLAALAAALVGGR